MTKEEKVQILTKATALIVECETDRVRETLILERKNARGMFKYGKFEVIKGYLTWQLRPDHPHRFIFADKSLAAIANN